MAGGDYDPVPGVMNGTHRWLERLGSPGPVDASSAYCPETCHWPEGAVPGLRGSA